MRTLCVQSSTSLTCSPGRAYSSSGIVSVMAIFMSQGYLGAPPASAQNSCTVFSMRMLLFVGWFGLIFFSILVIACGKQCRQRSILPGTQSFPRFSGPNQHCQLHGVGMNVVSDTLNIFAKMRGRAGTLAEGKPWKCPNVASQHSCELLVIQSLLLLIKSDRPGQKIGASLSEHCQALERWAFGIH